MTRGSMKIDPNAFLGFCFISRLQKHDSFMANVDNISF